MDHFEHSDVGSTVSHHNMDHNMPGMEDKCSMNMLFTWDWKNTCIVFKWWHVKTEIGFVSSLLAIVLLGALYEFVKAWFSKWERNELATLGASNASTITQENDSKSKGSFVWFSSDLLILVNVSVYDL